MTDVYAFLRGEAGEVEKFLEEKQANVEKQTLKEHVDKTLETLEEIKYNKIWKFASKLFGDERLVEDHLKTIVLFHDIGKLFHQANVSLDTEKGVKFLNFRGHEYFSTYLADEFFWRETCEPERKLVLSVILYHHHAMGLKKRSRITNVRVCKTEEDYNTMCDILKDIFKSYGLQTNEFSRYLRDLKSKLVSRNNVFVLNQRFVIDVYREIDRTNKEIWEQFVSDRMFRKKMLTFMVILQICDYKGSEGRTKTPPKFYRVLSEFVELYKV